MTTGMYAEYCRNGHWQAVLESNVEYHLKWDDEPLLVPKYYGDSQDYELFAILIDVHNDYTSFASIKRGPYSPPKNMSSEMKHYLGEQSVMCWDWMGLDEILNWEGWDWTEPFNFPVPLEEYEQFHTTGNPPFFWIANWDYDRSLFYLEGLPEDWDPTTGWSQLSEAFSKASYYDHDTGEYVDEIELLSSARIEKVDAKYDWQQKWRIYLGEEIFLLDKWSWSGEEGHKVRVARKNPHFELLNEKTYREYRRDDKFIDGVHYYVDAEWEQTYRSLVPDFWEETIPQLKALSQTGNYTDVRCFLSCG